MSFDGFGFYRVSIDLHLPRRIVEQLQHQFAGLIDVRGKRPRLWRPSGYVDFSALTRELLSFSKSYQARIFIDFVGVRPGGHVLIGSLVPRPG